LNYRHAFHAGNFADLVKHAAVTQILARMTADGPLTVIDTHAGRGLYDLAGPEARRSGEAQQGIARLMAAERSPEAFRLLTAAVAALNRQGPVRRYPGSPWLIAEALRPADRYIACELRAEEHAALSALMKGRGNVETLCADGYATAVARCPPRGQALVLIDPPFERADDYLQTVRTIQAVRRGNRQAVLLAWLPLKDLETFDRFLRDLEDAVDDAVVAETRMRPLSDPLKMNGCALALAGGGADMAAVLEAASSWVAALGEGGGARLHTVKFKA
jgi:23S rRNA (adenine2030-N6)-methyltransferase